MLDFHDPLSSTLSHPRLGLQPHSRQKLQSTPTRPWPLAPFHGSPPPHPLLGGMPPPQHLQRLTISTTQKVNALRALQSPPESVPSMGFSTPFPHGLPQLGHGSPSPLAPTTAHTPHLCSSAHFPQQAPLSPQPLSRPHLRLKGASSAPSTEPLLLPQALKALLSSTQSPYPAE